MFDELNRIREAAGLLSIIDVMAIGARGNVVYDPVSVLISAGVVVGRDNVLWPGVQLLASGRQTLQIGDGNVFHSGTRIEAVDGAICIGNHNEIGAGGFVAKTIGAGSAITFGDCGRYTLNCSISGYSNLGSGSQILGPIAADGCQLGGGGSYRHGVPDERGAVLKGCGRARGIVLLRGEVIEGFGRFDLADKTMQSHFHPVVAAL